MKSRLLNILVCLGLLSGFVYSSGSAKPAGQTDAASIMQTMTPREKVGQLFLVTFDGTDLDESSEIFDLITNYNIGGVVLTAERDNFVSDDTIPAAWNLTQGLQRLNWQAKQTADPNTPIQAAAYVPLYVGMSLVQGDNRTAQIQTGLTEFPSPMSIGATWSTELAAEVGAAIGEELSAIGVNLFLGPALDVIDTKDSIAASFANTQSFGGDPYWVGELSQAYVQGIHQGSSGKMSVIAQHFPGLGSVDRLPYEEVSTLQKTLEQLKQIELAPYMSVTGSQDPQRQVDGLMVSPIRFQGFQGNIRATTLPVNFDQTALEQLLSPEPIASWRENGGLTISDSLGSNAVRLFFSANENEFDPMTVARTAFLAGNDILFLDDFRARIDENDAETIRRTIDFFTQKYQEDALFASRVDTSVERILNAKLKIYPTFGIESVLVPEEQLNVVGSNSNISLLVNRRAVTLLSPSVEYLNSVLPQPPVLHETMTIFTDTRNSQQCSRCASQSDFGRMDFEDTLVRYYGTLGTNQLNGDRVHSYSLVQLTEILDQRTEPSDPNLVDNLRRSQWVVFNIINEDPDSPETRALKRILSERLDLLRDKRVIVFSYGEPYYLDSTDLANLTAYYALYNHSQAALDISTRILMREMSATGSLPVSLQAIDYQIREVTSPDPNQVIQVNLITPTMPIPAEAMETPVLETPLLVTPLPLFVMGENVRIQAGPIVDQNGNQVPDGTVVRFTVLLSTENLIVSQPEAVTQNGIATIDYRIEREGVFEVTAISEPARTSGTLVLNTHGGLAQVIMPTATPTPTPTPTLTPTVSPTPTPTATSVPLANEKGYPKMTDWLLVILIIAAGGFLGWAIGFKWWGSTRWGMRSTLCTVIGGLIAYSLLTLGIKPIVELVRQSSSWFIVQVTVIGMLFGWAFALAWWIFTENTPFDDALKRK